MPPNEKRGRVHTSTITVAVLPVPTEIELAIDPKEIEWSTCRPGGSGGQAMQKTESAVQLHHIPSGIIIRCESERSQTQNQASALAHLRAKLFAERHEADRVARNAQRREMIGAGERGDKRRTIRAQEGIVIDHTLDVRMPLRAYLRGDLEPLFSRCAE